MRKGVNCNVHENSNIDARREQGCAYTGPIGSCTKAINNGGCYTNIACYSNLNKRPCNTFLPMVNNNEKEYFLQTQAKRQT